MLSRDCDQEKKISNYACIPNFTELGVRELFYIMQSRNTWDIEEMNSATSKTLPLQVNRRFTFERSLEEQKQSSFWQKLVGADEKISPEVLDCNSHQISGHIP